MPKFIVETDQGNFEIDADREPSRDEVLAYLKAGEAGQPAAGAPAANAAPAAAPARDLKSEWAAAGPVDRVKLLAERFPKQFVETNKEIANDVLDVGLEAGAPAVGQAIGGAAAPFTFGLSVPFLGALFGAGANAAVQLKNTGTIKPGKVVGAAIAGAVPGASMAGASGRQVAKEGAKYAAQQVASTAAEVGIDEGRLPTVGEGARAAASGAAGAVAAKLMSKAGTRTADERMYAARDNALKAVRNEGVVVPPHELEKGIDLVSGIGGKAALQQQAGKRNQFAWQRLAREEIGLSKTVDPIAIEDLDKLRKFYAEPYRQLDTIRTEAMAQLDERLAVIAQEADPHAAAVLLDVPSTKNSLQILATLKDADVNLLRETRLEMKNARDAFFASGGDPKAHEAWKAAKAKADGIEDAIDRAAESLGDRGGNLLKALRYSRKKIAQTYSVEEALNPTTGLVDPIALGMQKRRGDPLTGNLEKVADFALAFRREAIEAGRIPAPGVGNLGSMMTFGMMSQGDAPGMVLGAINATAGKAIRPLLLSDLVQDGMLSPAETQNFSSSLARYIAQNAVNRRNSAGVPEMLAR